MKANGRPIQIDVIDWFNEAGDAITPLVAVAEVKEQPERKAAVALSSPPRRRRRRRRSQGRRPLPPCHVTRAECKC